MTPQEEERYENRLLRIEDKIDKLVEIVSSLARVEEQMAMNNKRMDAVERRIEKNENDIHNIAEIARQNGMIARFADKAFWLFVAGMVSIGVFFLQSILTQPLG